MLMPKRKCEKCAAKDPDLDSKIAAAVAQVLRKNFSEINSAIKVIGLQTGANPRAVRNWYEGRNAPSSSNIVLLARHMPAIIEVVLRLSGRENVWKAYELVTEHRNSLNGLPSDEVLEKYLADRNVDIKVHLSRSIAQDLNQRQLWFMSTLQQGIGLKADDIINLWKVSARTAWRDIAELENVGLIKFNGSKRHGNYVVNADFAA
jgi:hypothetical protein